MKQPRTIAVVAIALIALFPSVAAAATAWQSATAVTLPRGAAGIASGYVSALSCASAGNCGAAGAFDDANGRIQGLVLREVHGTWRPAVALEAPKGAAANPQSTIYSMSCASAASCAAVGTYVGPHSQNLAFVANESGGVWRRASAIALPPNAARTNRNDWLASVACTAPGDCSAVGTYVDNATGVRDEAMVVTQVHGTWRRAVELRLPGGANFDPFVTFSQISCPRSGWCSVVGSFTDANSVNQGLVIDQVAGAWQRALTVALPNDANAYANVSMSSLSCSGARACAALGSYVNQAGHREAMAVTEIWGAWQRAVSLTMPSGAAVNPAVSFYPSNNLSCPSSGNCSGGGVYVDASGHDQSFLVDEVDGAWTNAVAPPLPAGAQQSGPNGGITTVSCRSAGNCSAGGAYLDGAGNYQALVVDELNGVWQGAQKVLLPGGAATTGIDGGIGSLSCHASGPCSGVGSYESTVGAYRAFALTSH